MINFYSTYNKNVCISLREAVLQGLAEDGGLYMPNVIPPMPETFFKNIGNMTFPELSFEICKVLLKGAIPHHNLKEILDKAITFDAPLKNIVPGIHCLELFYGPTLSFKDFGSQFMAQLMGYFVKNEERELNILVATSGDTGSAVAYAFLNVPGIKVWILYPKGKVSQIQEKQLTTIGHNITALEIKGTFDDCQALVKQAFKDQMLRKKVFLSSANSINVSRLIPQTFYYFNIYARLPERRLPLIISVPCGNFGNLTAGIIAKRMGLPVSRFIAATNINDSVPRYLSSGIFEPHPSRHTLSNAMDVGNPSNFARMLDLYDHQKEKMSADIYGVSFTDDQTKSVIIELFKKSGYLLDPHGAVAYLGLNAYLPQIHAKVNGVFLETAHPAKFSSIVEQVTGQKVIMPDRLQKVLSKEKHTIELGTSYEDLKSLLI